jgi:DNA-binding NarL/FixJ family response regulator
MSQPIRLAIVEDDAGLREVLQRIFNSAPDFRVVHTCPDGETAVREIPARAPNVVLMDINLPGMSGIDCLRELKKALPKVRVVMVTVYDDDDRLFESLVSGADGYLLKRATRNRFLEAVREIVNGGAPISPKIARRMVEYFHQINAQPAHPAPSPSTEMELQALTARELEVLARLAEGLAPKEVAAELKISWDTVRNHITNIYTKLHVHSRSEAILKYLGRKPSGK